MRRGVDAEETYDDVHSCEHCCAPQLYSAAPSGVCRRPHGAEHDAPVLPFASHMATHWIDLLHAGSASHAESCAQQLFAVHASHALGPSATQTMTVHGCIWPQQAPCTHWPEQHADGAPQN